MTAIIVLNGQTDDSILKFKNDPQMIKNIYCADGGANFLYEHKIIPKVILGDMDSIKPEVKDFYKEHDCEFEFFKKEKDETDGQLIIDRILADGFDSAVILCALGGRLDHMLGNIQLLYRLEKRGVRSSIVSQEATVYIASTNGDISINGEVGQIVSVIPYEDNTIISLSGFGYNIDHVKFKRDTPLGISNYLAQNCASVNIHSGCALIIVTNDKQE